LVASGLTRPPLQSGGEAQLLGDDLLLEERGEHERTHPATASLRAESTSPVSGLGEAMRGDLRVRPRYEVVRSTALGFTA